MSEYHFPVPGHEGQKIIVFTRRHWVSELGTIVLVLFLLILPVIILVAIAFVNPAIFSGIALNFIVIATSIYYFVMTTYAYVAWVSYYYDVFIVTDNEIIDINQEGIFDRQITEVSIIRIQDVSARSKGFLQTFFSYGDVVAESAGEKTQTYVIDSVPNPVELANKILDLHNIQITKEQRRDEVLTAEGDLRAGKVETTQEITKEFQPPPPPKEANSPTSVKPSPPASSSEEGDISKEDLNKGGEIKF